VNKDISSNLILPVLLSNGKKTWTIAQALRNPYGNYRICIKLCVKDIGQRSCCLQLRRGVEYDTYWELKRPEFKANMWLIHNVLFFCRQCIVALYVYCCCTQCAAPTVLAFLESSPHRPSVINCRSKPSWRPWQQEDTRLLSSARTLLRFSVLNIFFHAMSTIIMLSPSSTQQFNSTLVYPNVLHLKSIMENVCLKVLISDGVCLCFPCVHMYNTVLTGRSLWHITNVFILLSVDTNYTKMAILGTNRMENM
jgi:hypothetical protein